MNSKCCWLSHFHSSTLDLLILLLSELQVPSFCSAMSSLAIFTFLLFYLSLSTAQLTNDTNTLLQFSSQTDTHANLLTNWTTKDACSASWRGVRCTGGRVTGLILSSLNLRGPIDLLSKLDQLRILDLKNNRLNGTILPITNCSNLKLLYLSRNDFSGEIPSEIGALKRLLRLDISDNNLQGPIPQEISKLTRIATIRLQNNILSGQVPDISTTLPQLKQLNMSNNQLYGKVPEKLQRKFGEKSFDGNVGLCGSTPLPDCSFLNVPPPNETVVQSSPGSLPVTTKSENEKSGSGKGLGAGAVVAIVVANAVVLLVITSFLVAYLCGRYNREENRKSWSNNGSSEKKVYASNGGEGGDEDRSKLVIFDRRKQFELDDLLRASAEMLGKGSFGTVYMAVLENGLNMAVKRLKDSNPCVRKEFEQYMDVIGKLRHPNIVRLRAYYYAKEEKLLVYDYLPNGSLHSLLHGSRGPGRIPLDWTTRISLVLGAVRGLARIHEEYNTMKIPHGNVKSSNVLLDKNGVACISDFGQALLLSPVQATARLGGYQAPEQVLTKRLSHQADVYSFGVLILEVLTGRAPSQYPLRNRGIGNEDGQGMDLPKWVRSVVREEWTAEVFDPELLRYKNIEEELVAMLHVGLACVAEQAEKRPSMLQVAKMIEDIRVEQSPLREDSEYTRNSISHSITSITTEDDGLAG